MINNELKEIDFCYSRRKPGKNETWDEYYIKGRGVGIDDFIRRIKIYPTSDKKYIKPLFGIDKISITLPREFINEEKSFYNTNLLTYTHIGQYTKIHFHAECFFFDDKYKTMKENIIFYLKQLINAGFIIIPIIYQNENTGKIYSNDDKQWYSSIPENTDDILETVIKNMKISEVEIFYDFDKDIFPYFDKTEYTEIEGTLYSKDYVSRKNYKQKSLVCIYDKGKKLQSNDNIYRIEYRLTGKYLKRQTTGSGLRKTYDLFTLNSFECTEIEFITNIEKYLGCLSNKYLFFDEELFIHAQHNDFYRITTNYRDVKRYCR